MKKITLLLLSVFLIGQTSFGEEITIEKKRIGEDRPEGKKWYFEFAGGYGFKVPRTQLKSPLEAEIGTVDYYQNRKELSIKPIFSSNGGGPNFRVGFGHMFNKYIGLDMQIILAFHPEQLDARTIMDNYSAEQYTKITAAYMAPSVKFAWDNGKRFGLYSKVGVLMPFSGRVISDAVVDDREGRLLATFFALEFLGLPLSSIPFLESKLVARGKTQLNPSAGLNASLGIDVKLTEKSTFFFEANAGFYTIRPKKTTFINFDMQNKILGLTLDDLNFDENTAPKILSEYVYVTELTETSNNPKYNKRVDIDKPLEVLAMINNGSSLFLNAGFRFNINRWEKRKAGVEAKVEKKQSKKSGSDPAE